ncbi:hypothetical protein TNCV_1391191 [Trichonephila clavipes]|nr:hypothetical protein TNCV_1391191 [Trichonephila clavipes]
MAHTDTLFIKTLKSTVAWWSRSWTRGWRVMSLSSLPLKTEDQTSYQDHPVGVVWKLGEGCQLRFRPRHLTEDRTTKLINSPRTA